jgi:hypothetical protein
MDAKKTSDRYREREAECTRHAELAVDDTTRRSLEDLAHQWHELAERTDRSNGRHRGPIEAFTQFAKRRFLSVER